MAKNSRTPRASGHVPASSREFDALRAGVESVTAGAAGLLSTRHIANGDEIDYADKTATFSKGHAQRGPGLVDLEAFRSFRNAVDAHLGAEWEVGLDAALSGVVPPPPKAASRDYAAELIELYWASLLRDRPFSSYEYEVTAIAAARELDGLGDAYRGPRDSEGRVTPKTLFRGGLKRGGKSYFPGEAFGPYVSQLLLHPACMGAQPLDRKFRTYRAGVDYLTEERDWAWVQNAGLPSEAAQFDPVRRHLRDGRSLAAFAYDDGIFQVYYVAHRVMAELRLGPNPGSPYSSDWNRGLLPVSGRADIVGTLNSVARVALDAVYLPIWNVHLRHRPEAGGGLLHLAKTHRGSLILNRAAGGRDELHDIVMSSPAVKLSYMKHGSYLLSQAYPEGAPSQPSYPSDRGAVAGACVTALKFYYDCERAVSSYTQVIEPSADGLSLKPYLGFDAAQMTFNSELGKLAHNVSFGHGMHAGANWRSDVEEGLLLGEAIALAWLKSHAQSLRERFSVKIRKFDGELETIGN